MVESNSSEDRKFHRKSVVIFREKKNFRKRLKDTISLLMFLAEFPIATWFLYIILVLLLLYSIQCSFEWLAFRTNLFAYLYASLFHALQNKWNITFIAPGTLNLATNRATLEKSYSIEYNLLIYWMLNLDSRRMNAYEEAVKQCQRQQQKYVWLDIGTGAHMPLTSFLIKHDVAEHVFAIESDPETCKHAKALRQSMPEENKQKITVYECHSNEIDWEEHQLRPNAIIHEIVGSVASDEGYVKAIHHTINSLNGNVSICVPHQIGTLCVPVSFPKVSLLSSLCSLALLRSYRIAMKCGVQPLVNPPKNSFISQKPQFIEKFIALEDWKSQLDKCTTFKTKFIVDKNEAEWTGFYLAPHILTTTDNSNEIAEINGLRHKTSWNVNYVHMFDHSKGVKVQKGDEIHIIFHSELDNRCPKYRLEAWVNDAYLQRSAVVWEGQIWL